MFAVFCCLSEDESELSDNEKELSSKGDGLINGTSGGLTINGCLSRDGEFILCYILWCEI